MGPEAKFYKRRLIKQSNAQSTIEYLVVVTIFLLCVLGARQAMMGKFNGVYSRAIQAIP
jgi:hypothetical protein